MALKRGLGKGLDALIPKSEEEIYEESKGSEMYVSIDKVEPNRDQPRKRFEEDALNELADSIKIHGIIDPLIVRKKDDYYEIVGGERRWRASKLIGLKEVPIIVRDFTDREVAEIGLIDNLQRENLNPIEEALAFKSLIEEYGLKQDELAERISKSRTAVTNSMRLLKLDAKVQEMVIEGMISSGHARALLGLPEQEDQLEFATRIFDNQLSVREVEKEIRNLSKEPKKKKKNSKNDEQIDAVYAEISEKLKVSLGTKVEIKCKNSESGTIEIEYYSKDQLEDIIEKLEA